MSGHSPPRACEAARARNRAAGGRSKADYRFTSRRHSHVSIWNEIAAQVTSRQDTGAQCEDRIHNVVNRVKVSKVPAVGALGRCTSTSTENLVVSGGALRTLPCRWSAGDEKEEGGVQQRTSSGHACVRPCVHCRHAPVRRSVRPRPVPRRGLGKSDE